MKYTYLYPNTKPTHLKHKHEAQLKDEAQHEHEAQPNTNSPEGHKTQTQTLTIC